MALVDIDEVGYRVAIKLWSLTADQLCANNGMICAHSPAIYCD